MGDSLSVFSDVSSANYNHFSELLTIWVEPQGKVSALYMRSEVLTAVNV